MLGSPKPVDRMLPRHWPRRVRSAVVNAISMSNVAFSVTRGHAEHHFNARVRLQAENDRLRREISLLHEELRIKDARMERIPPRRRPHYPQSSASRSLSCAPHGPGRWPRRPAGFW